MVPVVGDTSNYHSEQSENISILANQMDCSKHCIHEKSLRLSLIQFTPPPASHSKLRNFRSLEMTGLVVPTLAHVISS